MKKRELNTLLFAAITAAKKVITSPLLNMDEKADAIHELHTLSEQCFTVRGGCSFQSYLDMVDAIAQRTVPAVATILHGEPVK